MTREQKIAKAWKLREQGLTYSQIGREVGVTGGCVGKWLNPDRSRAWSAKSNANRADAKREWERTWMRSQAGRGECQRCHGPMGVGAAKSKYTYCSTCWHALADEKARRVEALWAEGLTLREIGQRMGWTDGMVGRSVHRYRQKGYDLPYRYGPERRQKSRERLREALAA